MSRQHRRRINTEPYRAARREVAKKQIQQRFDKGQKLAPGELALIGKSETAPAVGGHERA